MVPSTPLSHYVNLPKAVGSVTQCREHRRLGDGAQRRFLIR